MVLATVPAGTANPEKPTRHLLSRANLGKGSVASRVQIDLQSLLIGIEFLVGHNLGALFPRTGSNASLNN
jgi:hypothetical protein